MSAKQAQWVLVMVVAFLVFIIWQIEWTSPTQKPAPQKTVQHTQKIAPKPTKPKTKRHHKTSRTMIRTGFRYTTQTNTPSKRYAKTLVSATQWPCLHELWMRESGWSPTSDNPTSSAYGIPQILGLEQRTGNDYRKQVQAGLSYISHRYGTPCQAWSFWLSHRWY